MPVKIILDKKTDLKGSVLIEGFPGIGLVGTIASGYLIEKRKMTPIGHIYSKDFPPMVSIHEGKPNYPARIYQDEKTGYCILLSEFVIPTNLVFELAEAIVEFAKNQGIRQIISLSGMTGTPEGKHEVYAIVSNEEMSKLMALNKIKLIKEGVTTGVSGILLAECAVHNYPAVSILVESSPGEPDPRASAELLKALEGIIGMKVDTKDLIAEAGKIESNLGKVMDQVKRSKKAYDKVSDIPMYQ